MIRRYLDLILVFILTITVLVLRLMNVENGALMSFTGTVFVLFAPGYAITAALFKENVLEVPVKAALGLGISLSISAVGGIVLYGLGAPLTRTSWTVFLAIVVLVSSIVTIVQRYYNTSYLPGLIAHKLTLSDILLLVFSILVIVSGVYLSWKSDRNQAYVPFTEFWISSHTDDMSEIEIGLHSYEQTDMVYNVLIHVNGREVGMLEDISVQPGQEWGTIYILPPKATLNETVTVYLYTNNNPIKPYRWGQIHR